MRGMEGEKMNVFSFLLYTAIVLVWGGVVVYYLVPVDDGDALPDARKLQFSSEYGRRRIPFWQRATVEGAVFVGCVGLALALVFH